MAVLRETDRADFTFEVKDLETDTLRVVAFHGTEAISEPFYYEIELASLEAEVDFDSVVGQMASLSLKSGDEIQWVHGVVSQFAQTGRGRTFTLYTAHLRPLVWTLSLRSQSRIFQDMSTPEILEEVLEGAGLSSDLYKLSLSRSYEPRKYCVQYRESDLDFISRLMEEEGILFYFEHDGETDVLVIGDSTSVHSAIIGQALLPYHDGESGMTAEEQVTALHMTRSMKRGAVVLREFDFKKPGVQLQSEDQSDMEDAFELYDYPGRYHVAEVGDEFARIRLEQARTEKDLASGDSNCRRFQAGYKFELDGHVRSDFNQEYLLVRVHHEGSQPQAMEEDAEGSVDEPTVYENDFECIPATTPFRPERGTPRPHVEGLQTATVTGPSGEEIHTDEFGRVKVKFHWDRSDVIDDKSSCWIRVSQGWGGVGWGAMYIPRIGQEVIVEFLEGDPDRPLITGRVYNGAAPPPYPLPDEKTKSTLKSNTSPGGGGSNELRFEDAAGSEEVFVHAQKDMNSVVENDETLKVGNNRSTNIGVDQSVEIGSNKKTKVGVDHEEEVGSNQKMDIGANQTLSVGGNQDESIQGNRDIKILGKESEMIALAASQKVGLAKSVMVGASYSLTVGAKMKEKVVGNRDEEVGGSKSEKVGGDVKEDYKSGKQETISKVSNVSIGEDLTESIGGEHSHNVKKDLKINAKTINLVAEDEITIKTGKASIILKKNGNISIEGKDIGAKGSGDITLKAKNILEN